MKQQVDNLFLLFVLLSFLFFVSLVTMIVFYDFEVFINSLST